MNLFQRELLELDCTLFLRIAQFFKILCATVAANFVQNGILSFCNHFEAR